MMQYLNTTLWEGSIKKKQQFLSLQTGREGLEFSKRLQRENACMTFSTGSNLPPSLTHTHTHNYEDLNCRTQTPYTNLELNTTVSTKVSPGQKLTFQKCPSFISKPVTGPHKDSQPFHTHTHTCGCCQNKFCLLSSSLMFELLRSTLMEVDEEQQCL